MISTSLLTAGLARYDIRNEVLDYIIFRRTLGMHDIHRYIPYILYLEEVDHQIIHYHNVIPFHDHRFYMLVPTSSHLDKKSLVLMMRCLCEMHLIIVVAKDIV